MTTAAIKEKLHEYIEHAGDDKLQAIYTLVQGEMVEHAGLYKEEDLNSFKETSELYFAGKMKGSSLEDSISKIRQKLDGQ